MGGRGGLPRGLQRCEAQAAARCRIAAGLESETGRIDQIRQFIEYASSLDDVWFVTNQQVCESRWSGAESGWWRQEQGADECPAAGSWSQL